MKQYNKIFASFFALIIIVHFTFWTDNCKADWVQMNGPKGATVNCLTSNGNIIFAGTDGAGVFYSLNNGLQWVNVNQVWNSLKVQALLIKGSNLYAGTEWGLYVSSNNGLNWSSRDSTQQSVQALAATGNYLFKAIGYNGVFCSTDDGLHWISSNSGLPNTNINNFTVVDNVLYAGTGQGIFFSSNYGSNWNQIGLSNYSVKDITKIGSSIFAGTMFDGVFKSTNNGTNWVTYSFGLLNTFIRDFEVSGNDLYAGTDGGVFLLTAGGTMWNEISSGLTHPSVLSLMFNGLNFYSGTYGGGVFKSSDMGIQWYPVNAGLMYYNYEVGTVISQGSNLFAGTLQDGVQFSSDNGSHWSAVNNGLTHSLSISSLAVSGSIVLAGIGNYMSSGGLFISNNNGANWYPAGFENESVGNLAVNGANLYAAVYDSGIFHSSNNGINWTFISAGLTNTDIYTFAVSGSDIFAGTYGDGVFYSSNNGVNWNAFNSGLTSHVIFALAINGSTVFAGTYGGGVFRSTNLGMNWYLTGLTGLMITDIVIKGTNIFASASASGNEGIFKSNDNGISWEQIDQGLPGHNIAGLNISQTDLNACVGGFGLWRRPLSDLISVKIVSSVITSAFILAQNYPNPFNPVTNLEFGISDLGFTSLKVYDLLGKEVVTLVNEKLNPGTYRVEFDAGSLTSGVYFYRLTSGDFTDTKRMLLLK